ncbi:serine O-acetyltransferase [bacterium A37T11]|nr:serine O-acetyltransferase [bacterium A37T11]
MNEEFVPYSNEEFYLHLYDKHQRVDHVPANEDIAAWALKVLHLLYPQRSPGKQESLVTIHAGFQQVKEELRAILQATKVGQQRDNQLLSSQFFSKLPHIYRQMNTDLKAIIEGDPAAKSEFEVIRAYPGFLAIAIYRIAHQLHLLQVPLIPRILTEWAHAQTGIDIHPGATIGEYLYIDHGTGLVIGETTIIGNHVKLYQGVTLGAMSVEKYMANIKRHPTIEDHAIIYSGATILGGETVVGSHCTIGGNVWLTKSVPPHSTVYHQSIIKVVETNP